MGGLAKQHLTTILNSCVFFSDKTTIIRMADNSITDLILDALRQVYSFSTEVMMRLFTYDNPAVASEKLLTQSSLVTRHVLSAMKDHRSGLSIRQSRHNPPGVCWVDTTLAQFVATISRLVFDPAFHDAGIKDLVTGEGFRAIDSLHAVMIDSRLADMPL